MRFWAERGFEVTCFDLFMHEIQRLQRLPSSPAALSKDEVKLRGLPFEDRGFSAICAWNVLERLPFVLAQQYARECHRLLLPGGLLHAVFVDSDAQLQMRRQFEIHDRQQLRIRSSDTAPRLPDAWVDAETKLMLSPFEACEIQRAPCSTREILAQRSKRPARRA